MKGWLTTYNNAKAVSVSELPLREYSQLRDELAVLLKNTNYHLAHYFAVAYQSEYFKMILVLLDDDKHSINLCCYHYDYYNTQALESLASEIAGVHVFERDITERYGVNFKNSPYPKPLRFHSAGYDKQSSIDNFPFYKVAGESVHEVNVGPIHAGIIEPGAFRFNCNGEQVLHLEVVLGYQHRNIEKLITTSSSNLKRNLLAESIAGDSAVSHTTALCMALEKLNPSYEISKKLTIERTIALELERIAMNLADTGALCMDIGYQLAQVALEALRTVVINSTQLWCGNRFGKGLVRVGGAYHTLTEDNLKTILANLSDVKRRVEQVVDDLKNTPSLLSRFEQCGVLDRTQAEALGVVGMVARASSHVRDLRSSHPYLGFDSEIKHEVKTREHGDVMARVMLRFRELLQSVDYISLLSERIDLSCEDIKPDYKMTLSPDSIAVSLVESFRGETAHVAMTDSQGEIVDYRIKDASLHNWTALGVVLRGEGISDFPICNKSFNLSYCGFDL